MIINRQLTSCRSIVFGPYGIFAASVISLSVPRYSEFPEFWGLSWIVHTWQNFNWMSSYLHSQTWNYLTKMVVALQNTLNLWGQCVYLVVIGQGGWVIDKMIWVWFIHLLFMLIWTLNWVLLRSAKFERIHCHWMLFLSRTQGIGWACKNNDG